ncbi:MAG TPA: hypothetical protein VFR67_25850 [Pilimelia sp.]|nr:hypothetical protein [Pilimelia sp.]
MTLVEAVDQAPDPEELAPPGASDDPAAPLDADEPVLSRVE